MFSLSGTLEGTRVKIKLNKTKYFKTKIALIIFASWLAYVLINKTFSVILKEKMINNIK